MNSKNTKSLARRITAGAMMVAAAGAFAVGGIGAAANANAKPIVDQPGPSPSTQQSGSDTGFWVGTAYSSDTGYWATLANEPSFDALNVAALGECQKHGSHCILTDFAANQCIALAVNADNNEIWQGGVGPTPISASNAALQANGGGRIATATCTNPSAGVQTFAGYVNTFGPPKIKFRPLAPQA
jgi:hypothetical protein